MVVYLQQSKRQVSVDAGLERNLDLQVEIQSQFQGVALTTAAALWLLLLHLLLLLLLLEHLLLLLLLLQLLVLGLALLQLVCTAASAAAGWLTGCFLFTLLLELRVW